MLAHLDLTVLLALNAVILSMSEVAIQKIPLAPNEASLIESKDVLLQMLEKKLKEIKDSKKLKNGNGDVLPKNIDFNLKSNGISAVGEADLLLRYGKNGQGTVNMTAEGISNVGKVQLLMGTGDNGLRIPGLGNLFSGSSLRSGDQNDENRQQLVNQNDISFGFRRQTNITGDNATSEKVKPGTETFETENYDKAKAKPEKTTSNVGTAKKEGAINVAATGKVAMQTVSESNIATSVASNSPVANSDPPIKSDTVSGNVVASNGESVNKV